MSPYENPRYKNPTYQQVCTGQSGHGAFSVFLQIIGSLIYGFAHKISLSHDSGGTLH